LHLLLQYRCGHCKKLAPEWKRASNNLKGKVKLGHVNCDEEKVNKSVSLKKKRKHVHGFFYGISSYHKNIAKDKYVISSFNFSQSSHLHIGLFSFLLLFVSSKTVMENNCEIFTLRWEMQIMCVMYSILIRYIIYIYVLYCTEVKYTCTRISDLSLQGYMCHPPATCQNLNYFL
jgi:Thioredoxin